MTLAPVPAITTGVWREDVYPAAVWAGDIAGEDAANAPIELESYAGGWGILRTEFAWIPVSRVASSSALTFDLQPGHEVAPNPLDERIVRRAAAILSSQAIWNRADNRKCPSRATRWSIYCAMEKATIDETGGFHHRRPALEIVREIIDERTAGPVFHRARWSTNWVRLRAKLSTSADGLQQ